jgi:hypothetical protein
MRCLCRSNELPDWLHVALLGNTLNKGCLPRTTDHHRLSISPFPGEHYAAVRGRTNLRCLPRYAFLPPELCDRPDETGCQLHCCLVDLSSSVQIPIILKFSKLRYVVKGLADTGSGLDIPRLDIQDLDA